MSSADPDQELADLPEDLLSGSIYPLLPAYSLRAAAATSNSWRRALIQAPPAVRRRASWRHGWTETGAGASRHPVDFAVCAADGSWHPGGAALASSLHFSVGEDVGFRLIIEEAAPGDLLMGITLLTGIAAAAVEVGGDAAAAAAAGAAG
eukprot:CAMPEP_0202766266 /NCGR_PEP_ID=MMETSP1388-20130828/30144_1 /ASSEMBLY_ACC=CAM_ASM_000864 /TAXON_ID=37098 /ORGANISM="Isochrysis sp, Strain CCMP1244" /LENGTH=149 /DNA_ID=CAMNT_0049434885 /DNA_START=73 /DNA_END=518 /DNA_ORIENTATION=+